MHGRPTSLPSTATRKSRRSHAPAPGARVFCRVLTNGEGAEWPLSRKFGCVPQMAVDVLVYAHQLGLVSFGVSFHVGSQMTKVDAWDAALADAKRVFGRLPSRASSCRWSTWAGFPTKYLKDVPDGAGLCKAIFASLSKHFGNRIPMTIIEPGRGMVGNAGVIKAEVVLISKKSDNDEHRWVSLDIGKFGGLAETMDEAIRYPIRTERDADDMGLCVLAARPAIRRMFFTRRTCIRCRSRSPSVTRC